MLESRVRGAVRWLEIGAPDAHREIEDADKEAK